MKTEPRDHHLVDANSGRVNRSLPDVRSHASLAMQMAGFFLAPATFFAHLQVAYVLVPWSCASGNHLWLHVAGILSVLLAAMGTAVAWMVWTLEGRDEPGQHGGPVPRARFLAVTGFTMGAMFTLLLLAQWVAAFFLGPCS